MASHSVRSFVDDGNDAGNLTRNCTTIAELHNVLPLSFRPALGELLTKVYRTATKLGAVGNTIAQYERHITDGTYPPFIQNTMKVPKIQFSNEFDGTSEGKTVEQALSDIVLKARRTYLNEALKRKKSEQAHLLTMLRFDQSTWEKVVWETATRAASSFGAVIVMDQNTRKWGWQGSSIPSEFKNEAYGLFVNGNTYHVRAISIARAVADKALLQRVKNLTLKDKAKSDSMDIDSKDASVKDTIEEALKRFKQELTSGAITVKNKPTKQQPRGGARGKKPQGGRNTGRVNKPQAKKTQKRAKKN